MLEFTRITAPDHPLFPRAFALYEQSFPIHEQRTREKQEKVLSHPDYRYEVILEGIRPCGDKATAPRRCGSWESRDGPLCWRSTLPWKRCRCGGSIFMKS